MRFHATPFDHKAWDNLHFEYVERNLEIDKKYNLFFIDCSRVIVNNLG